MVESITWEGMDMKPSRFTEEQIIGFCASRKLACPTSARFCHPGKTITTWCARLGNISPAAYQLY